jgi:uncharacterized protein (DUF302 family)
MTENGLITIPSAHDVETTIQRLTSTLEAKDVTIFARIDHAADTDRSVRPTTVLLFGNPAAGVPLIRQAQTVGIDLPLKAMIWQDAKGTVQFSYNDPRWIAARHHIGSQGRRAVHAMASALAALAKLATAP